MGISASQRERVFSQVRTEHLFSRELFDLGWTMKERSHGSSHPTVYCELFGANGDLIQDGMGKGEGFQSSLSARFEALEHSITDLSQKMMQGIWRGSLQNAQSANYKLMPDALQSHDISLVESQVGYWKTFSSSKNSGTFLYPLSKLDPFSNYLEVYDDDEIYRTFTNTDIPWLKNNNGSAIGASVDDAFLHAYNEAIERYSLASLYVDSFLKETPCALRLISKNSLPIDLYEMLIKIETENEVKLTIIDMTSELGIPSFAAVAKGEKNENIAAGYGTSIFEDYALQRALLECQQILHTRHHPIYGPINSAENIEVDRRLSLWPKLKAAVNLDLQQCQINYIPLSKKDHHGLSVIEQRKHLEDLFRKYDIEVFKAITYQSKTTSICAVRILIPDFSDFSFIASGLPVTPSGRILRRFFEDL